MARACQKLTAWGTGMYDLDNDGWKDLIASTGSVLDNAELVDNMPTKLPNLLLPNLGGKRFTGLSAAEGPDFQAPARTVGSPSAISTTTAGWTW